MLQEGDQLLIKVENNGTALNLSSAELMRKGVGLANINDRLKNLYGNDYFFEIKHKSKGGVETIVRIPKA